MKKTFWQFNIGHLITIGTMVFSGGMFYGRYNSDTTYIKDSIGKLSGQYESLNDRVYKLESLVVNAKPKQDGGKRGSEGLMEK